MVQFDVQIDTETRAQFEKVCENHGILPSHALGMLIMDVVREKGNSFVKEEATTPEKKAVRPPLEFGCLAGKIWMADDFDEPLDDFKEYME